MTAVPMVRVLFMDLSFGSGGVLVRACGAGSCCLTRPERSWNASTISVTPRTRAAKPTHTISNHADRPGYPIAHTPTASLDDPGGEQETPEGQPSVDRRC